MGPYSYVASWSVDSSNVSLDPTDGHTITATGDGYGDACTTADMGSQERYSWDGQNCYDDNYADPIGETDCTEVVCAVPTNFHQVGQGSDSGNGTLHFDYAWASTTGRLSDLSQCTVGEKVDYNSSDIPFPSPPFKANISPPNPTVLNVTGDLGSGQDDHSTPGPFVKPYVSKTVTATQIYRYSCPCHNSGNWETLVGPLSIVRSVSQNQDASWKFTITKSGSSATINPLP